MNLLNVLNEASRDIDSLVTGNISFSYIQIDIIYSFMTGNISFSYIQIDIIYDKLTEVSVLDGTCSVMLNIILSALSTLCVKNFKDHLPGGCHSSLKPHDPELRAKLNCVTKRSVFAESVFGRLDQYLKVRPSASTLAADSFIMFSQNKTLLWLSSKSEPEQERELLSTSNEARKIYSQFKQRKRKTFEEKNAAREEGFARKRKKNSEK